MKNLYTRMCTLLLAIFILILATNSQASSSRDGEEGLIMGILPFMSPIALFKRFAPLRDYISYRVNQEVVFETASDFEKFVKRTNENHYDLILTAPHFVNSALDSGNYHLIATVKSPLSANIMVRGDSEYKTLGDLAGRQIAHAPDQAFIPIIGKKYIRESGLIHLSAPEYKAYRSHNAAYQALIAGETEAVIIGPYLVKQSIRKHALRLLGKSTDYPSLAVLVSNKISKSKSEMIAKTLVEMKKNAQGQQVLKGISCPGFRKARHNEYDILRTQLTQLD